jgi:hypothetical protein
MRPIAMSITPHINLSELYARVDRTNAMVKARAEERKNEAKRDKRRLAKEAKQHGMTPKVRRGNITSSCGVLTF